MSSSTQVISIKDDTWAESANPSKNHIGHSKLRMQDTDTYAYLFVPKGIRQGQTCISAKIRVYTSGAWAGTTQLDVQRINGPWAPKKLDWNNKPGVTGSVVSVSHPGADNTEYLFDVTALMQTVANGADWYGFRISTTASSDRDLHSSNDNHHTPTFEIEWSDAPQKPTDLSPGGGRAVSVNKPVVSARFKDTVGSTQLQAMQVQANATNVWTDPTFDTGSVSVTEPELDLNTFSLVRTPTVTKTISTPGITAVAGTFSQADVGSTITGTGIPGGTTIISVASSTAATMSANASSSGAITATITRTYPGLTAGVSTFWRVRFQDAAGLWSAWSDAESWNRDTKGVLTITNPSGATVDERTPPFTWTFTGETQKAWQLQIREGDDPTNILYDTDRVKGTALSFTLPKGVITDDESYVEVLRVWDTKDREHTPGDPIYQEATKTFTVALDAATVSPLTLTAAQVSPTPWVELTFTRASTPDEWVILRDGKVVKQVDGPDLFVSGTTYKWRDRNANPREQHTYEVQAVVNHKTSDTNLTVNITVIPVGIWLYGDFGDGDVQLMLDGTDAGSWDVPPEGETIYPLNSGKAIRVTGGIGGPTGTITGRLYPISEIGTTLKQQRQAAYEIRRHPGREVTLAMGTEAFDCVVHTIKLGPVDDEANSEAGCSIEFTFDYADVLPFKVRY